MLIASEIKGKHFAQKTTESLSNLSKQFRFIKKVCVSYHSTGSTLGEYEA